MNQSEIKNLAKSIDAKLVETHISWVLLTDTFAYKIKKPIKTSFLDFSTLQKRKHFCHQEILLNKEYTKNIYLKVERITFKNEEVSIEGSGNTIDYAVKMKRLDNSKEMHTLLAKNEVTEKNIRKLAAIISHIHKTTPAKSLNKFKSLTKDFEDLYYEMEASQLFTLKELEKAEQLFTNVRNFLSENKASFIERQKHGFIKEVHGDLHSGNIFLYPTPLLFDRIEFSKKIRTIDVLNEIAFLTLDLEVYNKEDLSRLFVKEYIKKTGFTFLMKEKVILIFYKAYVANIRAKVQLIALRKTKNRKSPLFKTFQFYFKAMEGYINELPKNRKEAKNRLLSK